MLETEIKEALTRYIFLLELLNDIVEKIDAAFSNDNRWFAMAPKIGRKFLNQAVTLHVLFSEKQLTIGRNTAKPFEDLSAIYTILRMQFETHALFYHLFIPGVNVEENILHFRLWELDGVRSRIRFNTIQDQVHLEKRAFDQQYLQTIEKSISDLSYYQALGAKVQKFLMERAVWRFTDTSLKNTPLKPISYDQLIRHTGIKEDLYADLYSYLSTHTHPGYVGVIQGFIASQEELTKGRYLGVIFACQVISFMIEDFSKRFTVAKKTLGTLTATELEVYESVRSAGRII